MNKWADYLISAVRYNDDSQQKSIEYVKVHSDHGQEIGAGSTWTKEEVVSSMLDGKTFFTIVKGSTGEWKRGAQISLVTKNGKSFITDDEHINLDFLTGIQEL